MLPETSAGDVIEHARKSAIKWIEEFPGTVEYLKEIYWKDIEFWLSVSKPYCRELDSMALAIGRPPTEADIQQWSRAHTQELIKNLK